MTPEEIRKETALAVRRERDRRWREKNGVGVVHIKRNQSTFCGRKIHTGLIAVAANAVPSSGVCTRCIANAQAMQVVSFEPPKLDMRPTLSANSERVLELVKLACANPELPGFIPKKSADWNGVHRLEAAGLVEATMRGLCPTCHQAAPAYRLKTEAVDVGERPETPDAQ